jgi:hypothetical protein
MESDRLGRRLIAAAAVLLGGCIGSGEGLDANGRPVGASGEASGELEPTIESIQQHVFTPRCASCHQGTHVSGLELEDAQQSHDELVDVRSTEVPTLDRVEPGDPEASYLIDKLEDTQAVGERMPLGQPPLPPETIAVIRQWISEGAAPPGTSAQAALLPALEL